MKNIKENSSLLEVDYNQIQKETIDNHIKKSRVKILLGDDWHSTYLVVDDQIIGAIQEIKFHQKADQAYRTFEIVFPNIIGSDIFLEFQENLKKYIKLFESIPYVKITFKDIEDSYTETKQLSFTNINFDNYEK